MLSLDLCAPRDLEATLDARGGFLWWYLELMSPSGNGLVLIWSFGLPFLPGLASAARRGQASSPRSRPSLNVVVYENGHQVAYALREFSASEVEWNGGGAWRFGSSQITASEREVRASFDIDLPSETRLTGRVQVQGHAPPLPAGRPPAALGPSLHQWTPLLTGAQGTAVVSVGGRQWAIAGHGYHDRNRSPLPLHTLGLERWLWAHARHGDEDRIAYALWPRSGAPVALGLSVTPESSRWVDVSLEARREHHHLYGMRTFERVSWNQRGVPWLALNLDRCVDAGPFYLRYLDAGGSCELIEPDRIDRNRHRPLVEMRVTRPGKAPSLWAPLFQGALDRRPERLGAYWRAKLVARLGHLLRGAPR